MGVFGISKRRVAAAIATLSTLLAAVPAWAGPPYVTDDPEPTEAGHWEVYGFVSGAERRGETNGNAGFDINYGALPDLQLSLAVPVDYERSVGRHLGFGDIELAAKYRFLHQDGAGIDLAFFPEIAIPTTSHRTGVGKTAISLPLWAQKDFGPWAVFGGGEYTINPGDGNRSFWSGGIGLQREITKRLSLGGEVYTHGRDADDAQTFTGVNLGATYRLNEHWSLAAAGGPGVQNASEGGRFTFYLALKADY